MSKVKGFTLIEVLVYLALFSVLMGAVAVTVYGIVEAEGVNQAKINLQEEGDFLLSKINWVLAGASSISVTTSPPVLSVHKYNSSLNPLVFDLDSNSLMLAQGSEPAEDLNSEDTQVSNLLFHDIQKSGQPEGVSVSFTLSVLSQTGTKISQDFEITNYLEK